MIRFLVGALGFVSVAILLFFAWWGWARRVRRELPPWRNGLAVSALLLLSLDWLVTAFSEVPVLLGMARSTALTGDMLMVHPFLFLSGILLAFALRGAPRVRTLLAALLMLVSWPLLISV